MNTLKKEDAKQQDAQKDIQDNVDIGRKIQKDAEDLTRVNICMSKLNRCRTTNRTTLTSWEKLVRIKKEFLHVTNATATTITGTPRDVTEGQRIKKRRKVTFHIPKINQTT